MTNGYGTACRDRQETPGADAPGRSAGPLNPRLAVGREKTNVAQPKVRRRGAGRTDCVPETVLWDAVTARLLPRLLKAACKATLFTTQRRPRPGRSPPGTSARPVGDR